MRQVINTINTKKLVHTITVSTSIRYVINYCKNRYLFLLISFFLLASCNNANQETTQTTGIDSSAAELKLPAGFAATVVADSLGALRHLAVNKNGDIYVKLSVLKDGKGILFLSDTDHDGKLDKTTGFGNYPGTGIRISGNELYASSNSGVYKYELNGKGEVADTNQVQTIVQGLVDKGRDNAKAIAVDGDNLYVAVGSYDETCTDSAGHGILNCPLLDSVGGIWQFKTNKTNQSYYNAVHYARGLKNVVGLDWNEATRSLFATQHGRGGLNGKFPKLYTAEQDKALPAETMYELHQGADAGWPYVYYDPFVHKKIVAPEYGGDGKKPADDNKYVDPVSVFPAHLGPNDLLFYTGDMFPERYKHGAFVVFHSQSQTLKKGYLVAFIPFKDGKPAGEWEVFADNFTGVDLSNPGNSYHHRPIGIAQGPDGALYVADDIKGTIFKISYAGNNK